MAKSQEIDTHSPSNRIEIYKESVNTLRHYSGILANLRTIVIIQGIIVLGLSVSVYDPLKDSSLTLYCLVFGEIMTIVFIGLNEIYYQHFETFLDSTIEIEKGLEILIKPWAIYKKTRNKLKFWHKASFYFIAIVFLIFISTFG